MAAFGEVVVHLLYGILKSTIDIIVLVATDINQLFQIISGNIGIAPPIVIFMAVAVLGLIIYGVFRIFKGELKPFIIVTMILVALLLFFVTFIV